MGIQQLHLNDITLDVDFNGELPARTGFGRLGHAPAITALAAVLRANPNVWGKVTNLPAGTTASQVGNLASSIKEGRYGLKNTLAEGARYEAAQRQGALWVRYVPATA